MWPPPDYSDPFAIETFLSSDWSLLPFHLNYSSDESTRTLWTPLAPLYATNNRRTSHWMVSYCWTYCRTWVRCIVSYLNTWNETLPIQSCLYTDWVIRILTPSRVVPFSDQSKTMCRSFSPNTICHRSNGMVHLPLTAVWYTVVFLVHPCHPIDTMFHREGLASIVDSAHPNLLAH